MFKHYFLIKLVNIPSSYMNIQFLQYFQNNTSIPLSSYSQNKNSTFSPGYQTTKYLKTNIISIE
jgi:hypothetical protein